MAITINTEILNQEAGSSRTYAYLYEPLRTVITEDNLAATKVFIDIEVLDINISGNPVIDTLIKYAEFDLNPGVDLTFDLTKLIQQHHDSNIYRISNVTDIINGWDKILTKNAYNFKIYSDKTLTPVEVMKVPIIGGRTFQQFVPTLPFATQPTNEFELLGLDVDFRWKDYPSIKTILKNPTLTDIKPTIQEIKDSSGKEVCGGYLIWKSRFGGWMNWGFEMRTDSQKKKYLGNIEVDMFESTQGIGGNPFIPVDYVGIDTSYSINLKSLALTSLELEAVSGIIASPAVYYMKDTTGRLELMRLNSATVPQDTNTAGGDFAASLSSISITSQNTR